MSNPPKPARPASGTKPRVGRVLVIDGDPGAAKSLRLALSDEFAVTATTQPAEALASLATGDWYDVILCEVMMRTMNGVELHDRVQARRPEQAARIVFVTGSAPWDYLRRLLDALPNVVLEKPIDITGVRELIRRRVRGSVQPSNVRRMR
jgi:CheY-like chemotaxis protein